MRFEVIAALVIRILLPLLETYRRGIAYWAVDFTRMFEDYVAGALLIIGGWSSYRSRSWGALFLVLAWAYVAGLMGSSFWYQDSAERQSLSALHWRQSRKAGVVNSTFDLSNISLF